MDALLSSIHHANTVRRRGKIINFSGTAIEASGLNVCLGEICSIRSSEGHKIKAEVIGFRERNAILVPFGDLQGVRSGSDVEGTGKAASVMVTDALQGRVVNAFGDAFDKGPALAAATHYPLYPSTKNPLHRARVDQVFQTDIRAIDAFATLGRGQRIGVFAGSGVGKSTLLGMIAKGATSDVNVIALIGERGREVLEFIEDNLGEEGLARSVLVVATSDEHPVVRVHAAYAASAIAEYFKDQGKDVLLMMDSITRFAMAKREIGMATGEPPTARGYPPSALSEIPRLVERAGNFKGKGSITAIYTVLVDGDDMNDPVADTLRACLDGHIVLSRKLAQSGQFPPVDVLSSLSRLRDKLIDESQRRVVVTATNLLARYEDARDLIDFGGYQPGRDKELDQAVAIMPGLKTFLRQGVGEVTGFADTHRALNELVAAIDKAPQRRLTREGRHERGQ